MRVVRSFVRLLLPASFALVAGSFARGQITSITNQTSTPIQGAGHDYIKMLNETVNPATGSVSVRIQTPTPPGRKMSLPFAFAYDSNGAPHVVSDGSGGIHWAGNDAYLATAGWAYSVPMLSNLKVSETTPGYGGPTTRCIYYSNYIFGDATAGRHSLYLAVINSTPPTCDFAVPVVPIEQLSGGDDYYEAVLTGYPSITLHIADADGTAYTFPPLLQTHSLFGSGVRSSLPSSIEDRNGNLITVTDLGAQGGAAGAFTVNDTLGRTLVSSSGFGVNGNTVSIAGLSSPYTLTWGTVGATGTNIGSSLLQTSPFGCSAFPQTLSGGGTKITNIQLPNNKSYAFSYDPASGLLSRITYPSGGYVSYSWGTNALSEFAAVEDLNQNPQACLYHYDAIAVTHRYMSFDGVNIALQQDFSYSTNWNGSISNWASKTTTVTTTDLVTGAISTTVYTYSPFTPPSEPNDVSRFAPQIPLEQSVAYKNSSGSTLRTVAKTWFDQYELQSEKTTLEDGVSSSQTTYTYGPGAQVTSRSDYDFPSGTALLRKTITNYQTFNATPIYPGGQSIFDRPCQTIVYDSSGTNRVAETDYLYDGGASVCGAAGAPSVTSVSNLPTGTHDEINYGPTSTAARGNLTKVVKQCFQGAQACASGNPTTTSTYDETGQVLTRLDACGNAACSDMTGTNHTTNFSYADSYTVLSGGVNINYTPSANTNAFLTQITDPLGHTQNFKYDFNNGQLTLSKDPNLLSTTYIYNDPLARPTQANSPDGGQSTVSYNDTAPSPTVTSSKKINSTQTLATVGIMDGLGHIVQSKLCEDGPTCAQPIKTDTAYDGLGRVLTQSNPHRTGTAPTDGTTTFFYDALGRSCLVVPPDGTLPSGSVCPTTSPANDVFTTYSGNSTTVKDQAGNSRKSVSDGLGRLTQVFEDPSALNYETDYTYDLLDNLLTANQKGNDPSSANWRTRSFAYDSLSRLTSSTNPESNTQPVTPFALVPTTYAYDANGNLSTKTAPAPNQSGTATVTTTSTYDVLNRLTQKSFSDSTPTAKYGYDAIAPAGCTLPVLTINNGIGKRTGMCDAAGAEAWSYDITAGTGWKITDARTTNSVTKSTIVQNNLAGSTATLTYPSGRIITYAFDAAARPVSAIDSTGPINYATAAAFAPIGALSSLTNGASLVSTLYYNNRLQPCRISVKNSGIAPATCTDAASGNVLDFTYNFSVGTADNGNVTGITNNRDTSRSQTFTYDSLNRISTAKTTSTTGANCWDEAFGYDPWGNMLTIGRISGYTCSNEELLNSSATAQNRISGDTYDTAGNLTAIPAIATYTYNAENQLTVTAGVTYAYDGDGRRVQKSSGKLYWYGMGSDPLDETDLAGNTNNSSFNEYIFFGGKRIARRDSSNNVSSYFADHLGTARIVANSSGTVLDDSDFYPFGGERVITSSSGNNYKFTAKERDSESGLDDFDARYYASTLGRFMRPDEPFVDQQSGNPQSWNLYSYVRNNPLNNTDPSGNACVGNGKGGFVDDNGGGQTCAEANDPKNNNTPSAVVTAKAPPSADDQRILDFANELNKRNVLNNTLKIAGAGGLIGATGGAACYYLCPAATVTTLGITAAKAAPLLPVVFGALQKLQQLGISVQEANEIIASPESQKLVDNLNNGNINVIKEVGGQLVRITTNPEGTRIISAGLVRANQIANGIANGRFVPKQ